jgi:S1-C subfamily serine protease
MLAGAALAVAGCGADAPTSAAEPPTVVEVETQRCRQPNRFHGIGVVVGDDVVLTAGHTVEGDLRELRVDGTPARVITIDRRTDLALLSVELADSTVPTMASETPEAASLITLDGNRDVEIDRHVTLVVEHATDRATYRRDVVIFTPGVADGDSGAPIVDDAGRLVGIVVADQGGEGVAVDADEVTTLLDKTPSGNDLTWPDASNTC